MSYKILIVENNKNEQKSLVDSISMEYNFETFCVDSAANALHIALKNLPHIVIIDITLPKNEGISLIENLRMHSRTKDVSIIALAETKRDDTLEKCLHLQIDGFIFKPIDSKKVLESIKQVILHQSEFISSYTNRFIRAFINLNGSGFYAKQMSSVAKIVCYKHNIDKQTIFDIQQILGLLSATFEKHSLSGVIRFYKDMDFAQNLMTILENFQKPSSIAEQIIHSIYFYQKSINESKEPKQLIASMVDKTILDEVTQIYTNQTVLLEKGVDFELLWAKFSDFVSMLDNIDMRLQHKFMQSADSLFKNLILSGGGGLVHFSKTEDELVIFVKPLEQKSANTIVDKVAVDDKNIKITIEKKRNGEVFITLRLCDFIDNKKEKKSSNEESSDTKTIESKETTKQTLEKTLSAKEYLQMQNIDMQDIAMLGELESEMLDITSLSEFSKDLFVDILRVSDYIRKYGITIVYLSEFQSISSALNDISEELKSISNSLNHNELCQILKLFEMLVCDLQRWREEIFINESLSDIHELDSSIIADIKQIVTMFNRDVADEEEIEFF